MDKKTYKRLSSESRQLKRSAWLLDSMSANENTVYARNALWHMAFDLDHVLRVKADRDHLAHGHSESLIYGSYNRMTCHITPKLKGI